MTEKPNKPVIAYTVEEFAQAAGLGVTTVRELIKKGELIASYVGRKPLISVTEGQRFIAARPAEKH